MNFHTSVARKIGVTNRSLSGIVPDIGSYESTLERDFMELMRFDVHVKQITPQPLTIGYFSDKGESRQYTPDGLVTFSESSELPPILYEIKYRDDFRGSWRKLMPKLRAAKQAAAKRGWEFKVFSEREIRSTYLDNVKFLWPYKIRSFDDELKFFVLNIMSDLQEADAALLSAALYSNRMNQARVIPVIWHLIAHDLIGCDLTTNLNMHSKIWTKEDL